MKIRLLDTRTGHFVEKDPKHTEYAILSHRWNDVEQSHQELRGIQRSYDARGRLFFSRLPVSVTRRALEKTRVVGKSFALFLPDHNRIQSCLAHHPATLSTLRFTVCHTTVIHHVWWIWVFSALIEDTSFSVPALLDSSSFRALLVSILGVLLLSAIFATIIGVFSIWDDPDLSPKIREACRVAREAGYRYLWIDSCCIDKTSSSELTESINSMFLWYSLAKMCYAYLADVPSNKDPREDKSAFCSSQWHKRGWTLQELIAPSGVKFLADDWTEIGTKFTLFDLIEEITGIPRQALLHVKSLDEFSVAQRLSWAARRQTTREEDRAYSLLGIFNINMPTLYGEGSRAFRRLQEEIVRHVPDLSLFAWNRHIYGDCRTDQDLVQALENAQSIELWTLFEGIAPLRQHISEFWAGGKIKAIPHYDVFRRLRVEDLPVPKYTSTSHGLRTKLPLVPLLIALPERHAGYYGSLLCHWYLVILGCEHEDYPGALLGQVCYVPPSESGVEYLRYGWLTIRPAPKRGHYNPELFPLSPATIARCREHIEVKTVYISEPEHATARSEHALCQRHQTLNFMLPRKARDALRAQGYTAELRGPDEGHRTTHWLTLCHDDHMIAIEYRHTLKDEDDGQRLKIKADVKVLRAALGSAGMIEGDSTSVQWSNRGGVRYQPWLLSLSKKNVAFTLAAMHLTMQLGFNWAAPSHYILRVEVVTETLQDTAPTSLESAHAEELQASGADDEKAAQDIEAEAEGSGVGDSSTIDDARLGMLDSEGSAGGPEAGFGGQRGARSESYGGEVDGDLEGMGGVSLGLLSRRLQG
ncbi:hypothetical protein BD309DRAFT_345892 [Dichomitus squalens]|nr:hypothetical protein BD309DRAFT_345892 [Dichomitus squalens]